MDFDFITFYQFAEKQIYVSKSTEFYVTIIWRLLFIQYMYLQGKVPLKIKRIS